MKDMRTPDGRFKNLPDYPFEPHYLEVPDTEGGALRVHYVDEGPREGGAVLLMHGEPSWSFLYRKMIPIIARAGYRVLAPDLVGFGKSDKPASRNDYTYQRHVDWMMSWLEQVNIKDITLFCQDWGGLIGLRLVCAKPRLFARIVAANTGLATGDAVTEAFLEWRKFSKEVPVFDVGTIMQLSTQPPFRIGQGKPFSPEVIAAYDAPFPDESYKEGARIFPSLVPADNPDDPGAVANREAWKVLAAFDKPFLTAFSDGDAVMKGGQYILQKKIAGAQGQPHVKIKDAGHFLQEDKGEEVASVILDFIAKTKA
jgi:haloalkane dehalogenase